MTPTLAYAVELLDRDFHAMPRNQETVDTLCAVVKAKGVFADCSWAQRKHAYHRLNRLYDGGFQPAEDALNRLVNLNCKRKWPGAATLRAIETNRE